MMEDDIWTANKYIKTPIGDSGAPRIPTLKTKNEAGITIEVNDNEDKAKAFVKAFFPPPPAQPAQADLQEDYPAPLPDPPPINKQQIEKVICRLSPYKVPGPGGLYTPPRVPPDSTGFQWIPADSAGLKSRNVLV